MHTNAIRPDPDRRDLRTSSGDSRARGWAMASGRREVRCLDVVRTSSGSSRGSTGVDAPARSCPSSRRGRRRRRHRSCRASPGWWRRSAPPLLQTPDQITDRPLVTPSLMLVPTGKVADPVDPTGTLSPAGVEETVSPARPVAVRVSAAVTGAGAPVPQTFATPPPPQVRGAVQTPQVSVPPQPSGIVPQFFPWAAQVVGVQGAGAGAGALATTPDQRVECVTPPTVQLRRIDAVLPAATV